MFLEPPVALGELALGVVDVDRPAVAEGISRLLVRSIEDARADVGGHLPGWLVDDIRRNYISPDKVRSLWARTGHRFALVSRDDEILGTVHVARNHGTILTADRKRNNLPAAALPGLKPDRYHQVVNVSVRHELRRSGLAAAMFGAVTTSFRHLFDGDGLWVRGDPPWHGWLARLGFVHDPAFDVFLPEDVERTSDLPHPAFNLLHACACAGALSGPRHEAMRTKKLQYVSFTRPFRPPPPPLAAPPARTVSPTRVAELGDVLAAASRAGLRVVARGAGSAGASRDGGLPSLRRGAASGPRLTTPREDVVVDVRALGPRSPSVEVSTDGTEVTVLAGTTWRALLRTLPARRRPPVVPGYLDATIGGSLSTGGIGKGSVARGLAIDHVERLVVLTWDGALRTCSKSEDRWLFEAVLGGHGRFGVVIEATLPLIDWPARVRVERKRVAPRDLVATLDRPDALHAFATRTAEGWLAIVVFVSDALDRTAPGAVEEESMPLDRLLDRERRDVADDDHRKQTLLEPDRAQVEAFVASIERLADPPRELTLHPIRQTSGSIVLAVTIVTTRRR